MIKSTRNIKKSDSYSEIYDYKFGPTIKNFLQLEKKIAVRYFSNFKSIC